MVFVSLSISLSLSSKRSPPTHTAGRYKFFFKNTPVGQTGHSVSQHAFSILPTQRSISIWPVIVHPRGKMAEVYKG